MIRGVLVSMSLLLGASAAAAAADDPAATLVDKGDTAQRETVKSNESKAQGGAKALSGMSILGNQEAPKALVIVPWKSSQLGDSLGISRSLDDGRQPVDKDVFMRELTYYEIRSK